MLIRFSLDSFEGSTPNYRKTANTTKPSKASNSQLRVSLEQHMLKGQPHEKDRHRSIKCITQTKLNFSERAPTSDLARQSDNGVRASETACESDLNDNSKSTSTQLPRPDFFTSVSSNTNSHPLLSETSSCLAHTNLSSNTIDIIRELRQRQKTSTNTKSLKETVYLQKNPQLASHPDQQSRARGLGIANSDALNGPSIRDKYEELVQKEREFVLPFEYKKLITIMGHLDQLINASRFSNKPTFLKDMLHSVNMNLVL